MIRCEALGKHYGKQPILQNASLTLAPGEFVGLTGESGCGKSTLARLLCGVEAPDSGVIYLDGTPLVSPKRPYDRARGLAIQLVWQQPAASLDPVQKLGAGLRELCRCHRICPKGQEAALIEKMLADVGLEPDILTHLPHQISGGEAQRVALARAMLLRPRLLILDEATSMLDVTTQANLLALVRRLMGADGAVLLISHDQALVSCICSRSYRLCDHFLKEVSP